MIQRYRGQRHRDDSGLQPDVVCDNARYMRARPAPSRDRVPLAWDAAWPWSIPANRGQPIWSTTGYVYPQNCPVTTKLQHVPTAPPLDQMATHGPGLSPSWICQTSATAEAAGLGHTTPTRTKQLPVRQHKTSTDRQRRPYTCPQITAMGPMCFCVVHGWREWPVACTCSAPGALQRADSAGFMLTAFC